MKLAKRRKQNKQMMLKVLKRVIIKVVIIKEKKRPKGVKRLLAIRKLRLRRKRSGYIMMRPSKDSLDGYPGVMMVSCPSLFFFSRLVFILHRRDFGGTKRSVGDGRK